MEDKIQEMNRLNSKVIKIFNFLKRGLKRSHEETTALLQQKSADRLSYYKDNLQPHYTAQFHIEQTAIEACYLNVKNKSTYEALFNKIIDGVFALKQRVEHYVQQQSHLLPQDVQKPMMHIVKYLEMLVNRLEVGRNINDTNFMQTSDYREAAREKLTDLFSSYFMAKSMQVVQDGFRIEQKRKHYLPLVKFFNDFLKQQGIYTRCFELLDPIDFELLIPESKKITRELELNGRIAELYTLPYFFNDPYYQGHALISEGNCVAFSIN